MEGSSYDDILVQKSFKYIFSIVRIYPWIYDRKHATSKSIYFEEIPL